MAHTNAIRVIIDKQPILSEEDRAFIISQLEERRDFYQNEGAYKTDAERQHAVDLFEQAITELQKR